MRRSPLSMTSIILIAAALSGTALYCGQARAGRTTWEAGLQAGVSFNNEDESFNQYDIVARYGLPWSWTWGQAILVDTRLTTALGILEGGGETGLVASAGFGFVFGSAAGRFPLKLRAGSALTFLSDDTYGEEDFGGPVQFTHHVALYYWVLEGLSAVLHLQHMSNGGLYSKNPGLDMMMLALVYRF